MPKTTSYVSDRFFLILSLIAVSPLVLFAAIYTAIDYIFYSIFLRMRGMGR